MSLSDYTYYIEKYDFTGSGLTAKEINFFNSAIPESYFTPTLRVDISEYLVSLSDIEFKFDSADKGFNTQSNLFYEDNDLNIEFIGWINTDYMKSFFGINQDTNYIRYKFKIYTVVPEGLIYEGFIDSDSITAMYDTSPEENIELRCTGYLKEFADWYSQQVLTDTADIVWVGDPVQINQNLVPNGDFSQGFNNWQVLSGSGDTEKSLLYGTVDGLKRFVTKNKDVTLDSSANSKKLRFRYRIETSDRIEVYLEPSFFAGSRKHLVTITDGDGTWKTTSPIDIAIFSFDTYKGLTFEYTANVITNHFWLDEVIINNPYQPTSINYNKRILLTTLLNDLLDTDIVNVNIDSALSSYYVSKFGCLNNFKSLSHSEDNYGWRFMKTGYDNIFKNGENIFGFLKRLCNSMGWYFYIYNTSLRIKPRYNATATNIITLDYTKFESYEALKTHYNEFDYIAFFDGLVNYGEKTLRGNHAPFGGTTTIFLTEKQEALTEFTAWYSIEWSSFKFLTDTGAKFQKDDAQEQDIFKYNIYEVIGKVILPPNITYYITTVKTPSMSRSKILSIDCGDTGKYGHKIDLGDSEIGFVDNDSWDCGDNGIAFKGNYGHCLFTIDDTAKPYWQQVWTTYLDYLKPSNTTQFKNNWNKYLFAYGSNRIKVKYNELLLGETYMYYDYQISGNDELRGTWKLDSIKYDLENEQTELELIKKL